MLARPPGPYRFNPSHPMANNIRFLVAPDGDNFSDLLTGAPGVKAVAASLGTRNIPAFGQCLSSVSGSASGVKFTTALTAATTNAGCYFGCYQFNSLAGTAAFFATSTALSGVRFEITAAGEVNCAATGVVLRASSGLGIAVDTPYFIGVVSDASGIFWVAANLQSGRVTTSTTTNTAVGSGGDQTFVVAGRISATTALPGFCGLAGYALPQSGSRHMMLEMARDPWSLVAPPYRRNYFTDTVAAAATGAIIWDGARSFSHMMVR